MTTIRKRLEAIRDNYKPPSLAYDNAVAALALLDEAVQVALVGKGSVSTTEDWRLIFDPDHGEDAQ